MTFSLSLRTSACVSLPFLFAGSPAFAQTAAEPVLRLEPFVVEGRASDLIGYAGASSQGSVGREDLAVRPFLRRGELLEVIPGVVITQHSGGGKANQYFLRGFNLDHGTDFAVSVDGMPVNMRSHAHGQGYSDLNFVMPEFLERIDYTKGPFEAAVGDFSAAGAARFTLFRTLPHNFVTLEAGENNYARFVFGETLNRSGQFGTTLGVEYTQDDGPWVLDENLRRWSGLVRHSWKTASADEWTVTALGYRATWNSTDQVPLRAIESGEIDRFGNIDSSDGGISSRASVSLDWSRRDADSATRVNAYAAHYQLNLYSNFTYFLDDPEHGDQFNQRDRRQVYGFSCEHEQVTNAVGQSTKWEIGVQGRADVIEELGLNRTERRERLSAIRNDQVREQSVAVFAKARTQWTSTLRTYAGFRTDAYAFDVESDNPLNSGKRHAALGSPKIGMVLGPWASTEFYANAGLGFHSNDARGTTIRVDPADRTTPVERVNPLVRSRGLEAGARTSALPGLVSTVSIWHLDLDSELVFVGDAGGTEASGATRRTGVEFANFYRLRPWLAFDADVSFTHARYREGTPEDHIANSISRVVTAGVVIGGTSGWFGSARVRHFGPQPLIEDDSVEQASSTTVNLLAGWRGAEWEFAVSVLNVLDANNADISYFYTSRLHGEPTEGVDDVHVHPAEPRTVRFSVSRKF